ncbi:MAG TPA: beta-N-acetylhexosaminidase [Alphaproteobacteria bacterium]
MSKADAARPRAVIYGCAGPSLGADEARFFRDADPYGFILFQRNCRTPDQVRALVEALRSTVGRADAPVLIDQEGGRVARLKPPHWRAAPPAAVFGALAEVSIEDARRAVRLNARLLAAELIELGIDVDCAPVLDVPVEGSHDVIGDRAFGRDPALVADLGRAAVEGFLEGGVIPVVKHVPGHGRATADSHLDLPVVDADRATLEATDFLPFRRLNDAPWAMTAHVLYRAIDPGAAASVSPRVVGDVIRGHIDFDGVLLSDDLSMKALSGGFGDRARAVLAAGCDLVLHCNGDRAEMAAIAEAIGPLSDDAVRRLARADARRARPGRLDRVAMLDELASLLDRPRLARR